MDDNGTRPEVWEVGEKNGDELHSGWGNQRVHLDPFMDFLEIAGANFRPTTYGRQEMRRGPRAAGKNTKQLSVRCLPSAVAREGDLVRRLGASLLAPPPGILLPTDGQSLGDSRAVQGSHPRAHHRYRAAQPMPSPQDQLRLATSVLARRETVNRRSCDTHLV